MIVLKEIKLFCTNDAIKNLRKFGFFGSFCSEIAIMIGF